MLNDAALLVHRSHDYRFLIQRWRIVAQRCGAKLQRWGTVGELPLYYLRTPALPRNGGLYISAGIHGDEAGATEGLITWAEREGERLRELPLLLFPCLNPWGLVNNSRYDQNGIDLNRSFHRDELPVISGWKHVVAPYRFDVALNLHEDYDGQGLYLYEIQRERPYWGEELIDAVRPIIPIEQRTKVDGRKSKAGLIRRRLNIRWCEEVGYPEAIWLHLHHSARTFTIESPSEFALMHRVAAQVAIIEECVRRIGG
ncbi:M14 family metallopeptidase [Verrucomicrobiota bacterium sgz303538]